MTVGEEVRPRRRCVRGFETPQRRRHRALYVEANAGLGFAHGAATVKTSRHPLLQQQLGRPDGRLVVEARAHFSAGEHVGEGNHRHPLMVRHIGADDGMVLALRQARLAV